MYPNRPLEPTRKNGPRLELNAGIFTWPVALLLYMVIGLFFGYLYMGICAWEHWFEH